jgi:hypothetical protein
MGGTNQVDVRLERGLDVAPAEAGCAGADEEEEGVGEQGMGRGPAQARGQQFHLAPAGQQVADGEVQSQQVHHVHRTLHGLLEGPLLFEGSRKGMLTHIGRVEADRVRDGEEGGQSELEMAVGKGEEPGEWKGGTILRNWVSR